MARITVTDSADLADRAAQRLTELIEASMARSGTAVVSLTGGTTPRATYEALADGSRPWRSRIDWARLHLFFGDERHVPPEHPDSNFGMAKRALITRVPIPPAHVHRIRGELTDAHDAARAYEQQLRDGFAAAGRQDLVFDVILLGLGDDCHIASIFPRSELLPATSDAGPKTSEDEPTVAAVFVPQLGAWRITLTPPVILGARTIAMLVAGETKAAAVAAAREAPLDLPRYPGQLLRRVEDRVEWLLDWPAAARLRDVRNA